MTNPLTDEMSEGELQHGVIEGAEWGGWMCYHVTNVRTTLLSYNTTAPGFQDCNLVHGPRALFVYAELKNRDRDKIPPAAQARWAHAVALAARLSPRVFAVRWRPEHYDEALRFLRGDTDTPPGIITVEEAERWVNASDTGKSTKRRPRTSRGGRTSGGRSNSRK